MHIVGNARNGFHVWWGKHVKKLCPPLKSTWRYSRGYNSLDFFHRVRLTALRSRHLVRDHRLGDPTGRAVPGCEPR